MKSVAISYICGDFSLKALWRQHVYDRLTQAVGRVKDRVFQVFLSYALDTAVVAAIPSLPLAMGSGYLASCYYPLTQDGFLSFMNYIICLEAVGFTLAVGARQWMPSFERACIDRTFIQGHYEWFASALKSEALYFCQEDRKNARGDNFFSPFCQASHFHQGF